MSSTQTTIEIGWLLLRMLLRAILPLHSDKTGALLQAMRSVRLCGQREHRPQKSFPRSLVSNYGIGNFLAREQLCKRAMKRLGKLNLKTVFDRTVFACACWVLSLLETIIDRATRHREESLLKHMQLVV